MAFPELYKKDSKGKLQVWKMEVLGDTEHETFGILKTTFGRVDGKMQVNEERIEKGKNLGRANETTPYIQTLSEAESRWTKQIERKGYVENVNQVDTDMREGAEPMLAHKYAVIIEGVLEYKSGKKYIKFPCFEQPKLDGHRCTAIVEDGICKLYSRQRELISGLPHVNKAIEALRIKNIELDGELYNHEYKDKFEELTGFIRSKEPKEGHEVVQYHLYDIVDDQPQDRRNFDLFQYLKNTTLASTLQYVSTQLVETEEQMLQIFRTHRINGYEGAILRNTFGVYVGDRSFDLQKVKEFDDDEFEIIGIKDGRGKLKGHAVFTCVMKDGKEFNVKMKGTLEKLQDIFQHPNKYLGRELTVAYQGFTKNGLPRIPIGLRIKD